MPHRLFPAALCVVAILLALPAEAMSCKASWYGGGERLSRHTANGERFNPRALTAAHRSWRFGTKVRVSHRGRSIVVRINDRGPAEWTGRCIDLSRAAASALGMIRAGQVTVRLAVIN